MILAKIRAFFEWMGQKALAKSRRSLDYKWTTYRSETPRQQIPDAPVARPDAGAPAAPAAHAAKPADIPAEDLTPSIEIDVDALFEKEKKPVAKKVTRRAAATASEAPQVEPKLAAKRTRAAKTKAAEAEGEKPAAPKRTTPRRTTAKSVKAKDEVAPSVPAQAELALQDMTEPAEVEKPVRRMAAKKSAETGQDSEGKPKIGRPRRTKEAAADQKPAEPKKRGRRPKPPGLTEEQVLECRQMFEGRTASGLVELLVADFPEIAGVRSKRQLLTRIRQSEAMFRKLKKTLSHSYHRAHREKMAAKTARPEVSTPAAEPVPSAAESVQNAEKAP
ncbi:MAG: hypothetical protein ACI4SV_01745 [Duodenibacillus sp.]